jgi:hypothetical protein
MADVEVKCEQCGAPVILSEYAAIATISCRACGAPLRAQPSSPTDNVQERLKLRQQERTPEPGEELTPAGPTDSETGESTWRFDRYIQQSRENIQTEAKQTGVIWSWVCFLLIAMLMASIRFLYILPDTYLEMLKLYGPYVALAMHVAIILMAFKDTVFQGILCLLIPGYSVFYLFLVSDNFWVRAVFGGVLVGIGFDSAIFYKEVASNVYHAVTDYIASGG